MKTTCFLFAVAGFGALTLGFSSADEPSGQPSGQGSHQNHNTGDHTANSLHDSQTSGNKDQTDVNHPPSDANRPISEKVGQTGPTKTPSQHPPANNPSHQTSLLNKNNSIAKDGSLINKPGSNSAQFTRPPVGGGTTALWPDLVRKQPGPTASLGGLTASSIKTSTAGINGTGMKRTIPR